MKNTKSLRKGQQIEALSECLIKTNKVTTTTADALSKKVIDILHSLGFQISKLEEEAPKPKLRYFIVSYVVCNEDKTSSIISQPLSNDSFPNLYKLQEKLLENHNKQSIPLDQLYVCGISELSKEDLDIFLSKN